MNSDSGPRRRSSVWNNAVLPSEIDVKDNRNTAEQFFRRVNVIAEKMISEPNYINEFYRSVRAVARAAIAKRDKVKE
ncbi:hypothetical protein [Rhizobium leguminosarum]|uniref:hypothetical protein n=1 Tax=Rhizobium leguminosarum TaxID=384 RepID=UPI00103C85C4|nr:hypothetical protein [Rhizobium leguminosarum]MBY5461836.1 hypothetical protein [Rhizobium leguminosarum]TCA42877.1 hypothetical protein E0H72_15715 [Rhizobium leguminosarum bv. viciae]